MGKKLQPSSQYDKYDINNDGVVSDEEFAHMSEIKRLEHDLRKQSLLSILNEYRLFLISVIFSTYLGLVLWELIWELQP